MNAHPSPERGQALIIVALSMVVLLGIGALVVDLGLSWMLRRHEQNAADPGAIAAARYIEEGDSAATRTKMHTAACFYAKENGFFESDDATCGAARASGVLKVNWPPFGPSAGQHAGNMGRVQVVISAQHASFFGAIFGRQSATVTTGAVASRETESANSNSLVALDPTSCASGKTHGNGDITIEPVNNPDTGVPYSGGYVHVNSACQNGAFDDACGSGSGGFHLTGNGMIDAPHVYLHGTCQASGGSLTSPLTEGAPQIGDPLASLRGPRQAEYPAGHCPRKQGSMIVYDAIPPTSNGCSWNDKNTTVTLTPGVYYGGWNFTGQNVNVRLQPGIYIIAGGGISVKGNAEIDSTPAAIGGDPDPTADPARVLIFSTDNTTDPTCATSTAARCIQGGIDMAGDASLKIWALDSGPFKGLLIWQDGQGRNPSATIKLTGQGEMNLAGTIYAPKALVTLEGNGLTTARLAVQIISWQWDVGGGADLYMPYDPSELYHITQRGLVH
jgi:Putative Flp pilus-assembly TadE/G-like